MAAGPLVVRGLYKRFGDVVALRGVDLTVEPGQLVGFLGPNGAGKTTTMRSILRLVSVDEGEVTWRGQPIGENERRRIGYMPQERGLYVGMPVHEHVAYFGRLAGLDRDEADRAADHWIDRVGLSERRDDVIQGLSIGNQQRVQLAVALVHRPDLLVMDEPFAGLDPVAVATLQSIITEQVDAGVGVVFSSHQLDLVQDLCEDVTIIAEGATVASGTVRELRQAAHDRVVEIRWVDPALTWTPAGDGAHDMAVEPGRTAFSVPATTDPGTMLAEASAAGTIATVTFEPPSLEAVFLELVGHG